MHQQQHTMQLIMLRKTEKVISCTSFELPFLHVALHLLLFTLEPMLWLLPGLLLSLHYYNAILTMSQKSHVIYFLNTSVKHPSVPTIFSQTLSHKSPVCNPRNTISNFYVAAPTYSTKYDLIVSAFNVSSKDT